MKGIVVLWGGAIEDIPAGWHLCDGSTIKDVTLPDLRNKIVIGAGDTYAVDQEFATNVTADAAITARAHAWIIKL